MKKYLLAFLLGIFFTQAFAQTTYTGTLASTDPTFTRPDEGIPPTTLSTFTNVYYNVIPVDLDAMGLITFVTNSSWDNFLVLYDKAGFNPLSPLTNALVANDDYSGPNAGFTYDFTSTGRYFLVMCSFKNNITGAYSVTASTTVVLPLKLVSFTAGKTTGNSNLIKWKSSEEINLLSYQVQRSSDNTNFYDLVNGNTVASNTTSGNSYSFVDNSPGTGYQYYRLKIAEKSGRVSYSPVAVVKISWPGLTNLKLFPNPATDYLQIEMKSMQNNKISVAIINASGNLMQSGQYRFNSQALLSIDIKKLPAGKYFLKTTIDKEEAMIMFIKN